MLIIFALRGNCMKHFLTKTFMCFTLLLQIHCTTISDRYSGKQGESIRQFCDKMFKDSGIQKVQKLEEKLKYQECLQKNFASTSTYKANAATSLITALMLGVLIILAQEID